MNSRKTSFYIDYKTITVITYDDHTTTKMNNPYLLTMLQDDCTLVDHKMRHIHVYGNSRNNLPEAL